MVKRQQNDQRNARARQKQETKGISRWASPSRNKEKTTRYEKRAGRLITSNAPAMLPDGQTGDDVYMNSGCEKLVSSRQAPDFGIIKVKGREVNIHKTTTVPIGPPRC